MKLPARLKMNAALFAGVVLMITLIFALVFEMQRAAFERSLVADEFLRGFYELNSLSNRYLRYPGERPKEQWHLVYERLIKNLESEPVKRLGSASIMKRMSRNLQHMNILFGHLIEANELTLQDLRTSGNDVIFEQRRIQLADLIIKRSRDLTLDAARLAILSEKQVSNINRKILILNPAVAAILTALTLWMSMRIGKSITDPVAKLRAGVEKVGSGDLDHRIGLSTNDEIGQLSVAFDRMTEHLKATTVLRDDLLREVAERKRAEEALRQSERYLNAIIENAPACIKLVASDGTLLKINNAGAAIIGASSVEQVQGKSIYPLVDISYRDAFMKLTDDVFQGKQGSLEFKATGIHHKRLWLSTHAVPLSDNTGKVSALLGITVDITERKHAEEERERLLADLERSNRELEQFAYAASHDLQEPLRGISSYAQLLGERYRGKLDEKADKFIHFIIDGANRMQKMIEALLAYSRIARWAPELVPVSLNVIFSQAVSNLTVAIRENRATVTKDELPDVLGDETQLIQLFQNLIGNAIKFRTADTLPSIHISAEKKEHHYVFSVSDNGIGIDTKHRDRIFMIFQRLHTGDQYPGAGIGLAMCKKIVEQHQGKIWVESEPGKGSIFFFTLSPPPAPEEQKQSPGEADNV